MVRKYPRRAAAASCPTAPTQPAGRRWWRGAARHGYRSNDEQIAVPHAVHLSCPKCGEIVLRFQDAKWLGEDAIAIYRKKHGLLSADETSGTGHRRALQVIDPFE